jgi:hypothetical protein
MSSDQGKLHVSHVPLPRSLPQHDTAP